MKNLSDKIITDTVERNAPDLGPGEKARVQDMTRTLWRGDKGIGQAVQEATDIVKSER